LTTITPLHFLVFLITEADPLSIDSDLPEVGQGSVVLVTAFVLTRPKQTIQTNVFFVGISVQYTVGHRRLRSVIYNIQKQVYYSYKTYFSEEYKHFNISKLMFVIKET
jgi:hypothetical protein